MILAWTAAVLYTFGTGSIIFFLLKGSPWRHILWGDAVGSVRIYLLCSRTHTLGERKRRWPAGSKNWSRSSRQIALFPSVSSCTSSAPVLSLSFSLKEPQHMRAFFHCQRSEISLSFGRDTIFIFLIHILHRALEIHTLGIMTSVWGVFCIRIFQRSHWKPGASMDPRHNASLCWHPREIHIDTEWNGMEFTSLILDLMKLTQCHVWIFSLPNYIWFKIYPC